MSIVHRLSSIVHRPSSIFFRLSSIVLRPSSLSLIFFPLALGLSACVPQPAAPPEEAEWETPRPGSTATPRPLPTSTVGGFQVELIASDLLFPQSLAFAPDGRLFFVEVKKGQVRVLSGKSVQTDPVAGVRIARGAEHGLVGLALDPAFDRNRYLYTFYTQGQRGSDVGRPARNRLSRWTERDGLATSETVVLDDLPFGQCCHTGGKMAFAADGSLFLTVGDQGAASRQHAQNPRRANGKLLRFDVNRVLRDRPDPATFVYASGLRNPYGLDIHPVTGAPLIADNGPDNCDELNLGRPGANFGNPIVECSPGDQSFDDPIWESGPDRLALTGLRIYQGRMFPEYVNHVLFCAWNTGALMRAVLAAPGYDSVERIEQVVGGQDGEGCRLDLAVATDGSIYYSSMTKIFRLYR